MDCWVGENYADVKKRNEWVLLQKRERESSLVIINSFLLLSEKLHLVCSRVPGLDVGLHLCFDDLLRTWLYKVVRHWATRTCEKTKNFLCLT